MSHKGIHIAMGAVFAIGLVASASAQGLYWESKTSGGPIGERTETISVMPKMMKTVSGDGEAVIIRLDKEIFITTDPKGKTYSEMTFAEMEGTMKKATGKMDTKMAEMQKRLAEMPEDQRKMVEQMMGNKMPGMVKDEKIEVEKSGDTKKISGFGCTKYVITKDGNDFMTVWTTNEVNGFDAMKKDYEEFSRRMMAMSPMVGKGIGEAFKKIDGFPIQTEMGPGMISTVTKVGKKATAASEFEVPSGYKKVKPKMMEDMNKMEDE